MGDTEEKIPTSGFSRITVIDYVAGAQEIVATLPTMGHVMSSLTYSAHGQYFLLRDNAYVDVAN